MKSYQYYLVDVFTGEPFGGNPTAVVLDAHDLTDEQMQLIAREFNVSETTFVSRSTIPDAAIRIRWFTPTTEVSMCGHGTIGAIHALITDGRFYTLPDEPGTILPIQINTGILTIRCERLKTVENQPFLVWLDLDAPTLKKRILAPGIWSETLNVPRDAFDEEMPPMETQDGDVIVFLKRLQDVMMANPDFQDLATFSQQQKVRGWCLASRQTLTPMTHIQSRFFAPAVGIAEDPVTGSVHGPLGTYFVEQGHATVIDNTAILSCTQSDSSGRAGLVRVVVIKDDSGYRTRIGGQCVVVMSGQLTI